MGNDGDERCSGMATDAAVSRHGDRCGTYVEGEHTGRVPRVDVLIEGPAGAIAVTIRRGGAKEVGKVGHVGDVPLADGAVRAERFGGICTPGVAGGKQARP